MDAATIAQTKRQITDYESERKQHVASIASSTTRIGILDTLIASLQASLPAEPAPAPDATTTTQQPAK